MYPSDIMILTEKSDCYARKEIQNLKKALRKENHQKVTIREYCEYYGLDLNEVVEVLSKFELKHAS
jgi:predicted transcriptional regulator of viral defense system